jgi:hypothetical protein
MGRPTVWRWGGKDRVFILFNHQFAVTVIVNVTQSEPVFEKFAGQKLTDDL